jgi:hypothetical protein
MGSHTLKAISLAAWLALASYLGFQFYSAQHSEAAGNCQAYDWLGRGIGCESDDLGDL